MVAKLDERRHGRDDVQAYLFIVLTKVLGAAGFVALLTASHYFVRSAYGLRVAALLWFATFGIAYVLVSSRLGGRRRRWP